MPKSSYAEFIQDWKTLLAAVQAHAADLPDVERHRLALQQQVELAHANCRHGTPLARAPMPAGDRAYY